MSIQAIDAVLRRSQSKGTARCVMVALANFAGQDGTCWVSIETAAEFANCSETSVHRALGELQAAGEIAVVANAGPNGVNVYRLLLPGATVTPQAPRQETSPAPAPAPAEQGGTKLAGGGYQVGTGGTKLAPKPLTDDSHPQTKGNKNQSVRPDGVPSWHPPAKSAPPALPTLSELEYWRMTFQAEGFNEPGLSELARAATEQHVGTEQVDAYLDAIFANKLLHDPHGYIVRNGAKDGFKAKTSARKGANAKPQTVEDEIAEIKRRYGGYSQFNGLMTFGADEIPSTPDDDKPRPQPPPR